MPRKYHTLLSRSVINGTAGKWIIEFGADNKAIVTEERNILRHTLREQYETKTVKFELKIISTGWKQEEIEAAVAELNSQQAPLEFSQVLSEKDAREAREIITYWSKDGSAESAIKCLYACGAGNTARYLEMVMAKGHKS